MLAKVLFSLNIVWAIFNFPFQLDDSEGMIVAEVNLMTKGVDLFAPPNPATFISAPYTLLYYQLNLPFFWLGGISFKPGRAISFLAAALIAFLIYKLVRLTDAQEVKSSALKLRPLAGSLWAGLIAALIWGSLGVVAFWGAMVKPDMTALAFSVAGIYFSLSYIRGMRNEERGERKENRGQGSEVRGQKKPASYFRTHISSFVTRHSSLVYLAAIMFAAAALTKQTAFAAPLAAGFCLTWFRWRSGLKFWLTYLAAAFLPMLAMQILSNGGFWWHIVTVHELPWSSGNYWYFMSDFLRSYQFFVVLAVIFFGIWVVQALRFVFPFSPKLQNRGSLYIPPHPNPSQMLPQGERGQGYNFFRQVSALAGKPTTLAAAYLVTAFGIGISTGTYGGNHNHFLEQSAAMCWCIGLLLVRLIESKQKWVRWVFPVVLVLMWVQILGMFVGEGRVRPDAFPLLGGVAPSRAALEILRGWYYDENWLGLQYRVPPPNLGQGYTNASYNINNAQGLVYSDNVSLMFNSGKTYYTTDPFTQTHATFFKRWDESNLVQMIKDKKFSLIVLREAIEDRLKEGRPIEDIYLSPGLAQAILENYRLKVRDRAFEYVPK
jgi:4-amino-4-deoxy-L-arabinose transferase-like glycosyltransferase